MPVFVMGNVENLYLRSGLVGAIVPTGAPVTSQHKHFI